MRPCFVFGTPSRAFDDTLSVVAVVVICDLGNRGVLASFLLDNFGMGHGHHPFPPRSLATLNPPCSRREFQMGQVPWMTLAPLEADRLPDHDRLFRWRQVEKAQASFHVTILDLRQTG